MNYKIFKKLVLDTTYPGIKFDKHDKEKLNNVSFND